METKKLYRSVFSTAAAIVVGAVALAGCSSATDGAASSGGPIIIGQSAGLTGFMSVFDLPVQQGMEMAIADINAKGGVLGRQLELVTTDNKTDSSLIQSAAQDALAKKAAMLVTSCDYDIGGPAAQVASKADIIAMSCAGGPLYGYNGLGPLAYNLYPGSPTEGAILAEYAKDKGFKNPYVITDQTLEYTQVVGDFFTKRWENLGGRLAGSDTYKNGDDSVAAQISKIKESNADLIIAASYPPGGATLLRQLRAAGLNQPIYGSAAFNGTYWTDAVPGLSNFTIPATGSLGGDDTSPARNAFFERIKKETGKSAASANYPLSGYSAVEAYAKAVQEAGSTDTKAVAAKLNQFSDTPLLIGPTTFTDTCHIPSSRAMMMIEYTNGVPKVVGERTVKSLMGKAPC